MILPSISLPRATVSLPLAQENSVVSSSSLRQTTLRLLLGTSMPTAALLGMGASMRTPVVASLGNVVRQAGDPG